ncbi:MAG TPA: hypothetical protein VF797_13635 [Noviherbaspirillum sp.]
MKHPGFLCFLVFGLRRNAFCPGPAHQKLPTKIHFFTLPPTLEDALFAVKEYPPMAAHFLQLSQGLSGFRSRTAQNQNNSGINSLAHLIKEASYVYTCV